MQRSVVVLERWIKSSSAVILRYLISWCWNHSRHFGVWSRKKWNYQEYKERPRVLVLCVLVHCQFTGTHTMEQSLRLTVLFPAVEGRDHTYNIACEVKRRLLVVSLRDHPHTRVTGQILNSTWGRDAIRFYRCVDLAYVWTQLKKGRNHRS